MKQKATLEGLVIFCPSLLKNITINKDNIISMVGWEFYGETISDSGVDIEVKCECGKIHSFTK